MNNKVMDRTIENVNALPYGYKAIDETGNFEPSDKGIYGFKYVGDDSIGNVAMHDRVRQALVRKETGYLVLAIDRAYKIVHYVRL